MLLSINLPHRLKKVSNFRRTAQKADDTLAHSAQFFKLMKSIIWNIQNEIFDVLRNCGQKRQAWV